MKRITLLVGLMVSAFSTYSQVGIGTTTPNPKSILELYSHSKGLLIPRMTGAERNAFTLTSEDMGMLVFQTDLPANPLPQTPKGLYVYDGSSWLAPLLNGTVNGQTLRWDGNKWVATSNLFNQGGSIGIGTTNPNTQLHINSTQASTTRLQFTNSNTGPSTSDGLVLGVTYSNSYAHLIQQENKPLWFGTNAIERMRIDSLGNVGINKSNPSSTLDVNGNIKSTSLDVNGNIKGTSLDVNGVINTTSLNSTGPIKVGTTGTSVNSIIRYSAMIDLPIMVANTEAIANVTIAGVIPGGTVQISPADAMTQMMIEYARVSGPGNVEVKFLNMSALADPAPMMFYITVIQ